ncbi:50S ribosomal protein L11 methyltransferase [Litorimonas sp. RW-G-Af-16]|uniref:50S ribosomal protein L11 methyltransferase n=1 Tax=Litorimonas sp. RW-G-Af-16 TaxID=3241168 RepID=UPI00390C4C9A
MTQANFQPYGLFIHTHNDLAFELSDQLGFEDEAGALAVSIFEDGPGTMHVQALFDTEAAAEAALANLSLGDEVERFITQLPDEDWVSLSQSGLPPVRAGRFFIYGQHDADKIPDDAPYTVRIEAGLAFGTGHHGTTKGCLLMLDNMISAEENPKRVLDLGCGAGILAIAAAKAFGRAVLATDIDPDAVMVTQQNADVAGVAGLIDAHIADGFNAPVLRDQQFDLIFANILAGPLMGLAPDIARALAPNGKVILSGILDELWPEVSATFEAQGLTITPQPTLSGWTSLLGVKPA